MRILVIVLALVAAGPAWAQYCQKEYATQPERIAMIAKIEKLISDPLGKIESVPPDVAQYIEKEQAAALEQRNSARFNMVASHQFYPALQVETHYRIVRENLAAARTAKTIADQAVFLSVVLSRWTDLTEALNKYIEVDGSRPKRVLGQEAKQDIWFMLPSTKSFVLLALQCGIRQMREP